jgi:hypothetical protein
MSVGAKATRSSPIKKLTHGQMVHWFERTELEGFCLLPIKVFELFYRWEARCFQPTNILRRVGRFLRTKDMLGTKDVITGREGS